MISFVDFVREAHGYEPYPWQARFAAHLAAETAQIGGLPPIWITAPTGAGKTTAIDAAIWALALQADRAPAERTVGVRSIWAIDRRILVDDVYEASAKLGARLHEAVGNSADALHEVAIRLLALASDGRWTPTFAANAAIDAGFSPLESVRWRGGVSTRVERLSPFQPAVITSTVQQVGSRLLFRGYGVSNRSRALEAALVARDATVFLDEAHLASPFADTVAAVIDHQRRHPKERVALPPELRLVTLTATPPTQTDGITFGLDDDDRARTELRDRLYAPKQLSLRAEVDKPVDVLTEEALKALVERPGGEFPIVAVVANRVRTATEVRERLLKAAAQLPDAPDIALLIGPQRPFDRRRQLSGIYDYVFSSAGPDSAPLQRPIALVATQTFEVGLDADVSHLITQSASVSALVQRFGRVNRAGKRSESSVVVVRDEGFALYDGDEPAAWQWLTAIEADGGDVSVAALLARDRPEQTKLPSAPVLTDIIVQQLAQTSEDLPVFQEPDVDGLLRGAREDIAQDVTVCWRADLLGDPDRPFSKANQRSRCDLLRLAPPQTDECLALPLSSVKQLLTGDRAALRRVGDAPDVPGALAEAETAGAVKFPFVVLRGRDVLSGVWGDASTDEEVAIRGLRPGDTVVLPTEIGGIDDAGLRPGASPAIECRLELDAESGPALPYLRLTPLALGIEPDSEAWAALSAKVEAKLEKLSEAATPGSSERWIPSLSAEEAAELFPLELATRDALVRAMGADAWAFRPLDSPRDADLTGASSAGLRGWVLRRMTADTDGEERLGVATEPPTLEAHCAAVAERAGRWADALAAGEAVAGAIRLAAAAHDLGKADPRVQNWFAGGVRRIGAPAMAKSEFGTNDPARSRAAKVRAGVPDRLRHEIASVAALASAIACGEVPEYTAAVDESLALHLVGTHHGFGRPSFPFPAGGKPAAEFAARLETCGIAGRAKGDGMDGWDGGAWDQRFWELHDRFGPWTVAYLEALVMLADRTVSKEGR